MKLLGATVFALLLAGPVSGCGSQSNAAGSQAGNMVGKQATRPSVPSRPALGTTSSAATRSPASSAARRVSFAPVVVPRQPSSAWKQVAAVGGAPAAWITERSGVTLMRFDQGLLHLALHAGSLEPGGGGWSYGDMIGPREIHAVVAGFNGGFKLNYGSVGYFAEGRSVVRLASGLGSIVTYQDGTTQIGAWRAGVPVKGRKIASVLQNLHLLIDHGEGAGNLETCISGCWGLTLGGGTNVPRSALGITGDGQLVWAGGESLSPAMIARALIDVGVQRAVELDINPEWVAGYLYVHHAGGPTAVPVIPGQAGIPGQLLAPYSRDFFTVHAS